MKKTLFIILIGFVCMLPSCVQKHCPEPVATPCPNQKTLDLFKSELILFVGKEQNDIEKRQKALTIKSKQGPMTLEDNIELGKIEGKRDLIERISYKFLEEQ